jgi:hypothetical protein
MLEPNPLSRTKDVAALEVHDTLKKHLPDASIAHGRMTAQETELQYLVPSQIGDWLKHRYTPVYLKTFYFAKQPGVIKDLCTQADITLDASHAGLLTTARLRESIFSNGKNIYQLEFKGPKECSPLGRLSRAEVSVEISKDLFLSLRSEARYGSLEKLRYGIPGFIFCEDGHQVPITLQLDELLKAGAPARALSSSLYRADVEVSREDLAQDIRAGRTSFAEILRSCLEVSALPKASSRRFSNTTIARNGISSESLTIYKELLIQSVG